ncbi:hypothetical protein Q9L58_006313 [Maublancomyces gigas]|uniref:Uncharacterized protein n=1 Tax=Discina gigas TaxID=1032678 RepID=A0ABR3GGW8_9PEZI
MPEKFISALPVPTVSSPNPAMHRSKKKLRMESHYFNTSLALHVSKTHGPRRPSTESANPVETVFPTTKYKMNSNSWFQHAFGIGANSSGTQESSAPYNGKIFSGRPKHYDNVTGKSVPTNLMGFSQLYKVGDDSDDVFVPAGTIDFTRVVMDSLGPISIGSDKDEGYSSRNSIGRGAAASAAATTQRKSRKREPPKDFEVEQDKKRVKAQAKTEETWMFGRALAKKHVHSLWRDTPAGKKWVAAGGQKEQVVRSTRLGTVGGRKQLYDRKGNKSFLFLQMTIPSEDMVEIAPSPISPV